MHIVIGCTGEKRKSKLWFLVLTYDENCRSPTTGDGSLGRITLMINGAIDRVFQEGRFQALEHVSHGRVSAKHSDQKGDFLLSTTSLFQTAGEVVYTGFVGHVSCILIHLSHITGLDHVKTVLPR